MRTDVKAITDRIEHVLASEQWAAIKKSFATRMDVIPETSFTMKERLSQGELKLQLNYEVRGGKVCLTTYFGGITPYENGGLVMDKENTATEVLFNAEGKYVFSFQEAINLLEGRAVLKSYYTMDAVQRTDWFKLDKGGIGKPMQPFFSGGQSVLPDYDLERVLGKLPMVAPDSWRKPALIRSLRQGDLQEVSLIMRGKELTMYVQAAPEVKGLAVFDDQMRALKLDDLLANVTKVKQQRKRDAGLSLGG